MIDIVSGDSKQLIPLKKGAGDRGRITALWPLFPKSPDLVPVVQYSYEHWGMSCGDFFSIFLATEMWWQWGLKSSLNVLSSNLNRLRIRQMFSATWFFSCLGFCLCFYPITYYLPPSQCRGFIILLSPFIKEEIVCRNIQD